MEENKTAAPKASVAKKSDKKEKSFGDWFKEIKAEYHKIAWPNKEELGKMTFTVVVTCIIFGVMITSFDAVFGFIIGLLVDLV